MLSCKLATNNPAANSCLRVFGRSRKAYYDEFRGVMRKRRPARGAPPSYLGLFRAGVLQGLLVSGPAGALAGRPGCQYRQTPYIYYALSF